jgi:hypothetical protein
MKKNNTKENTMKTYNYTHPRYFVDARIENELGHLVWIREPFVSKVRAEVLICDLLRYHTVYDININLEEELDKEVLDEDFNGLGYTRRMEKFGGRYQDNHEYRFDNFGFDRYVAEIDMYSNLLYFNDYILRLV